MIDADLARARVAATKLLHDRGYDREAATVAAGGGDHYAEVRLALSLLAIIAADAGQTPPPTRGRFGRRLVGEEC
ncbi:MAG: hypothetical protein ABW128_03965 [Rhizorhabdus sp.]